MKYIDAEKLIDEIERYENGAVDAYNPLGEDADFFHGKVVACEDLKELVTSLQQEQQEGDLGADIEMEWDSFNKHLAEYGEESEEVVWLNWNSFNELARYFYNIGLNARKEDK